MRIDKQAIVAIGRLTLQRHECLKQPRLWGNTAWNLFVCLIPCALEKGKDPVLLARTFTLFAARRAREIRESLYISLVQTWSSNMHYVADMGGDFEKGGRSVAFEAPNELEALAKAAACLAPDEFVYEVWTTGNSKRLHCVWDFVHGFNTKEIVAGLFDGWKLTDSMLPGKDDHL